MPEHLTSLSTEDYSRGTLPGFVRPVNYVPEPSAPDYVGPLFPNALINDSRHLQQLTTVREFAMMAWMEEVCNKPDWHVKVNNREITKKWKEETLAAHDESTFSSSMVDYCISELKDRAKAITDPNNPPPYLVFDAGVYRSDTAVSPELKKEIQDAVAEFESRIPEKQKDWHPNSDEMVWDLVHPSLFPLVYGKSRILPNGETVTLEDFITKCGTGETIPEPTDGEVVVRGKSNRSYWSSSSDRGLSYSKRFQWLPCEVDIKEPEAKITSYINNLHPAYNKRLYGIIERVITVALPLWALTLARIDEGHKPTLRICCNDAEYDREKTYETDSDSEEDRDDDDEDGEERPARVRPPPRKLIYPEPDAYLSRKEITPINLREKYGHRGLQVIVKLANIHLTPEKPEYAGGTWHVEGQLNEHIVSTALYYYSNENITQSTLSFRQQIETEDSMMDFNYAQDDHDWLKGYFGCENEGPGVQEIGSIKTSEGRLLTFPNTLQHRVGPFKLEDPTKPGHRKIIALFLVDPNIKIISTANVPCQRRDWWWELVTAQRSSSGSATPNKPQGLEKLPVELKQHVLEDVDDFPLSLEAAKELRLELMEERTAFVDEQTTEFEEAKTHVQFRPSEPMASLAFVHHLHHNVSRVSKPTLNACFVLKSAPQGACGRFSQIYFVGLERRTYTKTARVQDATSSALTTEGALAPAESNLDEPLESLPLPSGSKFRILFMGRDEFSCDVLRELHAASDVWESLSVVTMPDSYVGRRKSVLSVSPLKLLTEQLGIEDLHFIPEQKREFKKWPLPPPFVPNTASTPPPTHLLLTASFGRILTKAHLSSFHPTRRLNVHPSLLPAYRGPAPIQHTLLNNDERAGVCVIEMLKKSHGIDAGRLWGVGEVDLASVEEAKSKGGMGFDALREHLGRRGGRLVVDLLRNMLGLGENGQRAVVAVPQSRDGIKMAPMIGREDAHADFEKMKAEDIVRVERAIGHQEPVWTHLPGAATSRVQLFDLSVVDDLGETMGSAPSQPGEFVYDKKQGLLVKCHPEDPVWLRVGRVKKEGKKEMPAADFWKGVRQPKDNPRRGFVFVGE